MQLLAPLLLLIVAAAPISANQIFLPKNAQPEGVAHAIGTNYFVGDLRSGAVFLVDISTGLVTTAVQAHPNRTAVGLSATKKKIFVAGGGVLTNTSTNRPMLYAYDIATGATLAACAAPNGGFVNDVFAAGKFAYFTDSFRPWLYRLRVSNVGRCKVRRIPLPRGEDAFKVENFVFRANGIVKYKGGLIITNSAARTLYFIDLKKTGNPAQMILPPGSVPFPDGLEIQKRKRGRFLYIAQNALQFVSVWKLSISGRTVSVKRVKRIRSKRAFDVPTTVAVSGRTLVVANSRFDDFGAAGPPPQGERFSIGVRKF